MNIITEHELKKTLCTNLVNLTDKNKDQIKDNSIFIFDTYEKLSELSEYLVKSFPELLEKQKIYILTVLFDISIKVLDKSDYNYSSPGWIHLLAFLSKSWSQVADKAFNIYVNSTKNELGKEIKEMEATYKNTKKIISFNNIWKKFPNLLRDRIFIILVSAGSSERIYTLVKEFSDMIGETEGELDKVHFYWSNFIFSEGLYWGTDEKLSVLFHILGNSLNSYEENIDNLEIRTNITVIVPTLIRRFIDDWGRTSLFIEQYIESIEKAYTIYHSLYHIIVDIQNNFKLNLLVKKSKPEIRNELSREKFTILPNGRNKLTEIVNNILHGKKEEAEAIFVEKLSKVCQITFLVKRADINTRNIQKRDYLEYLKHEKIEIEFLRLIKGEKWINENSKRTKIFSECLSLAWRGGVSINSMSQLFRNEAINSLYKKKYSTNFVKNEYEFHGIYWITDGEISFYFIIFVLIKAKLDKSKFNNWVKDKKELNFKFSVRDFLPPDQGIGSKKKIKDIGKLLEEEYEFNGNFTDFFTKYWILFDEKLKPTDRFWSLYNFLERSEVKRINLGKDLIEVVTKFYQKIKDRGESRTFDLFGNFKKSLNYLFDEVKNKKYLEDYISFLKSTRLSTFMLEVLFRWEENTPRTLFFYPMMFESVEVSNGKGNTMVKIPTIFLAGTLMGIEKSDRPFVSNLNYIMIFPIIEMITPFAYYFLGKRINEDQRLFRKSTFKTAIISILVDSYAHNLSAHSLVALKWWFEKRVEIYDKRIYLGTESNKGPSIRELGNLQPQNITNKELKEYSEITDIYYKILGLGDSNNDRDFTSILETVRFSTFDKRGKNSNLLYFNDNNEYKFPVPIDHALVNLFRFLRDKAAFWSGVTRDFPFGGEIKNLYDILWNDFADNPLYLGTIAYSEGINKLNINIKIENTQGKSIEGDFAVINMSVIKNEADPSKCNRVHEMEYNFKDEDGESNCKTKKIFYSDYALVYPGKHHFIIREELKKSEYNIFLPGGVVGKHAFFTIIENTIRNVKHLNIDEDMKENGLYLKIRISPAKLMDPNKAELGSPENKLFKIGIYLSHSIDLMKKIVDDDRAEGEDRRVLDILNEISKKTIIDEGNGSPRLGGNSQDKICAAMLLNNTFSSVTPEFDENKTCTKRNNYYFNPDKDKFWINFEEEYIESDINKGYLIKYFNLWKGDFVYTIKNIVDIDEENVSRFKIVYIESDEDIIDENLLVRLKDNGVIRIITKEDFNNIGEKMEIFSPQNNYKRIYDKTDGNVEETFKKRLKAMIKLENFEEYLIYKIWLEKFLNNQTFHFLKSFNEEQDTKPRTMMTIENFDCTSDVDCDKTEGTELYVHHSGNRHGKEDNQLILYRSHGWLRENIIKDDEFQFYEDKYQTNIMEFVEILSLNICIIDNRINNRIDKENKIKYSNLGLNIYHEFKTKEIDFEKNQWDGLKQSVLDYNFFVVHLSFIEALGYKENEINSFFENELAFKKEKFIPKKTIIVITTGRGRSEWIQKLDKVYKKYTIFKPIESILNAVESAISYKDDIQLKYNLAKILFGS